MSETVDAADEERVGAYFERGGFRLQLDDLVHSDAMDVRMGTFVQAAALIDALALAYCADVRGLGKSEKWDAFVRDFFPQPKYAVLVGAYSEFRSTLLHKFAVRGFAFTHGRRHDHLKVQPQGLTLLNRANFVEDVVSAFEAFVARVRAEPELRRRVLRYLDERPPISALWLVEDVVPGPDGGTLTISASASYSPSQVFDSSVDQPPEEPRRPKVARSVKTRQPRRSK